MTSSASVAIANEGEGMTSHTMGLELVELVMAIEETFARSADRRRATPNRSPSSAAERGVGTRRTGGAAPGVHWNMPIAAAASIVWVIVDGAPRHVSEFATLTPRRRPNAICPQCGRRLTLKLGPVRRHHAAHDPGAVCAATNPETALHLDCKLALASTLRHAIAPGARLSIVERCAGVKAVACDERRETVWASGWTDVLVEHRVREARRPDLVLARDGVALAAIEVVVTSAVSAEKARALMESGVPWIEVRATEELTSPDGWAIERPLCVARTSEHDAWRCAAHAGVHASDVAATIAQRAAEREAERRTSVLRAARVVDVYHARGVRERFVYRIDESLVDGRVESLRLRRGGVNVCVLPADSSDEARAEWPTLRVAFTADVEGFLRDDGSFSDSPMRWARGDAAENIVDEALGDRVGRDPTPLATRYPRRWFYSTQDERWFLPDDMREVRWDRESPDAFAAHPAWPHRRSAVRERPAPEGSWKTPVFSSRPTGAMFAATGREVITEREAISIVDVARPGERRRVIVVVARAPRPGEIVSLAGHLRDEKVDAVWISHPSDWCDELSTVAWAPAGRDWYGRGGIVVDGLGVFRADQFARALAKRDRRLTVEAIRARMEERVAQIRAARNERV